MGMGSGVVCARLRSGDWVVAVGDATVGRIRGDVTTGFRARLDDGDWMPTLYADLSAAAEVVALEASLRGE